MAPVFSSKALIAFLLLGSNTYAAPLNRRQLHGEGVAADALLTDTDNGIGVCIPSIVIQAGLTSATVRERERRGQPRFIDLFHEACHQASAPWRGCGS
jgi:hypothetical protein